jgi:hypothetical protein
MDRDQAAPNHFSTTHRQAMNKKFALDMGCYL